MTVHTSCTSRSTRRWDWQPEADRRLPYDLGSRDRPCAVYEDLDCAILVAECGVQQYLAEGAETVGLAELIKLTAEVDVQWATTPTTYPELVPWEAHDE